MLKAEMTQLPQELKKPPLLSVQDLRISFGSHEAVHGVSFAIAPGRNTGAGWGIRVGKIGDFTGGVASAAA